MSKYDENPDNAMVLADASKFELAKVIVLAFAMRLELFKLIAFAYVVKDVIGVPLVPTPIVAAPPTRTFALIVAVGREGFPSGFIEKSYWCGSTTSPLIITGLLISVVPAIWVMYCTF
jgi:hypothetical protein